MSYAAEYERSLRDPEGFWREQALALPWLRAPTTVLDQDPSGAWRWFRGGRTNTAWLALDRHVAAGRGDRTALIYDSPVTGRILRFSYAELLDRVARIAGGLAGLGVGKGDRVIIYMPLVQEAAMAMLACARIGAVHSVVFAGFSPDSIASRLEDSASKLIITASAGQRGGKWIAQKALVDEALTVA